MLLSPPVLAHFDPSLPIELRSDASQYGLGAILVQKHPSGWRPVAFVSSQMNAQEQNYTVSERECLAIIFALEKFKPYLDGQYFKIITDHCSLCFLKSKAKLPPRLMRWAILLQEFHFDIEYKSGKHHLDVDCLSRFPVPTADPDETDREISILPVLNNPNEQKAFIIEQQEGDNRIKRLKERILLLPSLTQKERK